MRQHLLFHDRTRKILEDFRISLGLPVRRTHQRGGKSSALQSRMASLVGKHLQHAIEFQEDLVVIQRLCLNLYDQ